MKNTKFFAATVLAVITVFSSHAQQYSIDDINLKFNDFSESLSITLPNAAAQQNVYSEAWIGKFFPSKPPHFAAGVELGVTKFDISALSDVTKIFGVAETPSTFIFPTFTGNLRIGGVGIPFDLGFSFMTVDFSKMKIIDGFGIKYLNIGGDVRFAICQGKTLLPQISLGAGYYYTSGKVYYKNGGLNSALEYGTHTLFLQAQISKTLVFFTPYAGFRAIFSKSDTDWSWSITDNLKSSASSYTGLETASSGKTSNDFFSSFIPQVYAGFGLKFSVFALNFGASWDFKNSIWAGDLSVRFQL